MPAFTRTRGASCPADRGSFLPYVQYRKCDVLADCDQAVEIADVCIEEGDFAGRIPLERLTHRTINSPRLSCPKRSLQRWKQRLREIGLTLELSWHRRMANTRPHRQSTDDFLEVADEQPDSFRNESEVCLAATMKGSCNTERRGTSTNRPFARSCATSALADVL